MWAYEDVRAAFEDEHPHNMVDASDAYVLTVYSFGRNDEHPDDYETEDWETGMMVGSGFLRPYGSKRAKLERKVNGSRSLGSPRVDWLPALRRVTADRIMVVRVKE